MEQLEILKRKIDNEKELKSLVRTMKTLAFISIREYGQMVGSLNEYQKAIEMGLEVVMKNVPGDVIIVEPSKKNRLGAIIFGSEQGMCGKFNEIIANFAIKNMDEFKVIRENRTIMTLGDRVISQLEDEGEIVEERFSYLGNHAGITQIMLQVLTKIEEWRTEQEIDRIVLFYNMPISGSSYRPHVLHLLPLDKEWFQGLAKKKWVSRSIPTFTMDRYDLFSSLIRQYLFLSLYRALIESLASENASRLASMQKAEKNIEERLSELHIQYHSTRQDSITMELLDVVTGFEALTNKKR
ncbi:MAG: F0F1 ATP synthase subunit gamma [Candidatus Methanoperedens sp.]|nr:F0F1 ATP synthase subunit gamma [Candidatus Methanoperedens sp.]